MRALLTISALLILFSCKKDSASSGEIDGTWAVDTYTVSYYDAAGKVLSDYNSLPPLKNIIIEGDSLTLDNSTPVMAGQYSQGRALSEQNAITLPVNFMSFNAKLIDGKVALSWSTAHEINNSHFEVQMTPNGQNFEEIGRISGTNAALSSYSFTVAENLFGACYFKLKQVDFDGKYSFTNTVMVQASRTKIPLIVGDGKSVLLPRSFAPFRSADVKRISSSALILLGRQSNVTFVKNGSITNADHAEMKIVFKKK